ncbi:MAG: Ig-like domain-containing protein [Chthonomonadaceae bacterium]|nr:Ig-like domain-containing protein [Chthonomonadaceae bacterium]
MRVRWTCALVFAVCAAVHAQTGGFMLVASNPAAGATNVPVGTTIQLTFNGRPDPASMMVVRGARQNVLGSQTIDSVAHTITLTPFVPLDPGSTYTVDFSNVRDVDGSPAAPPTTFQFSTEGSARIVVTSLPTTAQAGAGERVPLTYLVRNLSPIGATLSASRTLYLLPDGTQLLSLNGTLHESLGRNASLTLSDEAVIEPAMVAAARASSFDRILVVRVLQGLDANGNALRSLTDTPVYNNYPGDRTVFAQGLVAVTQVRLISSVTGAVVVRELTVSSPTEGLAVQQGGQVRGRALITASGNGIVIGRWLLDGTPFESFQASVHAGSPTVVGTVRPIPTVDVGERRLQLEILSPNPMRSRESHFTVSPLLQSGRPRLVAPAFGAVLGKDAPVVLRWQVVPGASGYEIGIAPTLAELGLDAKGKPASGGFDASTLAFHQRVLGASQTAASLSADAIAKLRGAGSNTLFWTVRPLFPPSNEPMQDRAAFPGSIRLEPGAEPLALLAPGAGGVLDAKHLAFAWAPPFAATRVKEYRVQVFAEGDEGTPLFQALTSEPRLDLDPVGGNVLMPGRPLKWRVLAYSEDGRLLAMSPSSRVSVVSTAPTPMLAPMHTAFGQPLKGVAFTPAEGARLDAPSALMVAYPASEAAKRRLLLDGTDVSALATFGETGVRLPPRALSGGLHTLQLLVETSDGEALEARSWFEVAPQEGEGGNTEQVADGLRLLLQSELHDDDPFHIVATLEGAGALGTAEGSMSVTATRPLEGGTFEVRTLLGNLGDRNGRYDLAAGDVGLVGSEFTVDGSTTRAFQANAQAGGLKFNFTKTLDDSIGRSNFGNSPDVTMGSLETAAFNEGTGLRFVQMRSEQANSSYGATGYGQASGVKADIWSVIGRYRLGDSFSLRGEMAHSKNSFRTLSGTRMRSSGDAQTLALDYKGPQGWNATARYRRTETGYLAPSAALLQNSVQGWDVEASGPIGMTTFLSVRYGRAENVAGSSVPDGDTHTLTANLDMQIPDFVPLQLSYQQTEAKGDSLVPGLPGADTRDSTWTLGTSHRFGPVDASLSYSVARYRDYQDFNDPLNDTPNDRTTRFVSVGLGYQSGRVALRGDWSDNGVSRFDRDPLTFDLIDGHDRQDNLRLQADYELFHGVSASAIWSRARHSDVLGLSTGDVDDVALRLNWSPGGTLVGQSIVTLEFRRSKIDSGGMHRTDNTVTLLVNGAGIFGGR